jgi:hypothetical protein
MTGIFLMIVVGLWLWACVAMTRALMRRWKGRAWGVPAACAAFVALLVAPVADEIIGGIQFRALCQKNAVFRVGVMKPEGRITKFSSTPSNEKMPGTAITIYHSGIRYTDVRSDELVVSFDRYLAQGGLFIRTLGISENNSPITMNHPSCSPEQALGESVHRTLKFSVVD